MATIVITVNVNDTDRWEGNAEDRIEVEESNLQHVDTSSFGNTIKFLIENAIKDYEERNK